eukprot:g20657.t1
MEDEEEQAEAEEEHKQRRSLEDEFKKIFRSGLELLDAWSKSDKPLEYVRHLLGTSTSTVAKKVDLVLRMLGSNGVGGCLLRRSRGLREETFSVTSLSEEIKKLAKADREGNSEDGEEVQNENAGDVGVDSQVLAQGVEAFSTDWSAFGAPRVPKKENQLRLELDEEDDLLADEEPAAKRARRIEREIDEELEQQEQLLQNAGGSSSSISSSSSAARREPDHSDDEDAEEDDDGADRETFLNQLSVSVAIPQQLVLKNEQRGRELARRAVGNTTFHVLGNTGTAAEARHQLDNNLKSLKALYDLWRKFAERSEDLACDLYDLRNSESVNTFAGNMVGEFAENLPLASPYTLKERP